jgi:prevent-host-death family protein
MKYDNMIIMESYLTATEAARNFSDLVNRVLYRGEVFVIQRGGQPVCRIVPAKPAKFTLRDLAQLLRTIPKPDPGYWDVIEDITRKQPPLPKSPWER